MKRRGLEVGALFGFWRCDGEAAQRGKSRYVHATCTLCGRRAEVYLGNLRRGITKACHHCAHTGYRTVDQRIADGSAPALETGCVFWLGGGDEDGYAHLKIGGRRWRLGRYLLGKKLGRELRDDEEACHTCDNPPCINPDHLFAGSKVENQHDKVAKNRHAKGARQGAAKMDDARIAELRAKRRAGASERELADEYGLKQPTVSSIVLRRSWKHVPDEAAVSP